MRTQAHEHVKCKRSRCEGAVQELPQCQNVSNLLLAIILLTRQPAQSKASARRRLACTDTQTAKRGPGASEGSVACKSQITRSSQHHRQGPSAPEVALLPAKFMSRSRIPTITLQSTVSSWLPCLRTLDMFQVMFQGCHVQMLTCTFFLSSCASASSICHMGVHVS